MSVSQCCQHWQCRWSIKGDGTLCHEYAYTLRQGLSNTEEKNYLTAAEEAADSGDVPHHQCKPAGLWRCAQAAVVPGTLFQHQSTEALLCTNCTNIQSIVAAI